MQREGRCCAWAELRARPRANAASFSGTASWALQVVSVAANSVATELCSMEQLSKEIAVRLSDLEVMKVEEGRKHRLNLETQVIARFLRPAAGAGDAPHG